MDYYSFNYICQSILRLKLQILPYLELFELTNNVLKQKRIVRSDIIGKFYRTSSKLLDITLILKFALFIKTLTNIIK